MFDEKVLLFCPQVSEDVAFKYMLQLTNCVKTFSTLLLVSDRGLFYSGDTKDRAERRAQSKQNMILMLPVIPAIPVSRSGFSFFPPVLFWCFLLRSMGEYSQLCFGIQGNHQLLLLASVQLHKKTACMKTCSAADRSSKIIQQGIFDSCCAERRYVLVKVPLEFFHKL